MATLKGKLEFISFWDPIRLISKDGEVDLRTYYFRIFTNLNGKKASMSGGINDIKIFADESSDRLMKYENKGETIIMILEEEGPKWGMANLGAYIPDMLQRLNGMMVIVEFNDESIHIYHNESEKVYELNYTYNNSCKIPDDKIHEVCKIGTDDCCIFLTVGGNGFLCEKFNSWMAHILLDRYSKREMNAKRIGNCKIIGRIKENDNEPIF